MGENTLLSLNFSDYNAQLVCLSTADQSITRFHQVTVSFISLSS